MLNKTSSFIKKNNLPAAPALLVIGVSGGADSVALLHIMHELGYKCVVAHCNFHLRGEESMRDANFVKTLANDLQLPYFSKDFDTNAYAKDQGISIEMAARELRYTWFEEVLKETKSAAVAVAHHADDVVETFLMNLTRGTGIHGLTGIKVRNGNIIRPFLSLSRNEIELYLSENKIAFINDSSNAEEVYIRNKFRLSLIPAFERINPAFKDTILKTIVRLEDVEQIYNESLDKSKTKICTQKENILKIDIGLLESSIGKRSILHELISPLGFSSANIDSILINLRKESGKRYYSNSHQLLIDRDFILISPTIKEEDQVYELERNQNKLLLPIELEIEYIEKTSTFTDDKTLALLDVDKLQFPLIIRKWQKGDFFVPFGMKNKKKLSDFFIDLKLNRLKKEQIWVLVSGNDIVWVIGERIDNRYRVSPSTREILKLKLINLI